MPESEHLVRKEMGYTRDEFMRHLPEALDGADMRVVDNIIQVQDGAGRLRIELGPESERQIGFFRIPKLPVDLYFSGYGEAEIEAALARFARAFQKGGG